jgi:pimeloyl-ACP methyl ester carboxylesterase
MTESNPTNRPSHADEIEAIASLLDVAELQGPPTVTAPNVDGDTELLGTVTVTHRFHDATGILWHYVEAGPADGDPVVMVHGIPESWWSWHHQIEYLVSRCQFRVIAIDLKGYGQSDKRAGDYRHEGVADELLALLDALGLDAFHLVTADRGSNVGDYLAGNHPERIRRYVRAQKPAHRWESGNSPQQAIFGHPVRALRAMANPAMLVPGAYQNLAHLPIPADDVNRAIAEFGYEGIWFAVPRYFQSSTWEKESADRVNRLLRAMTMPVLLLQGEHDPGQPLSLFEGAVDQFPNAELSVVRGAGHFHHLEDPAQVNELIAEFLTRSDLS